MDRAQLEQDIDAAWDARDSVNTDTGGATRDAVNAALGMLDDGSARVAEPLGDHQWQVNQWLKKAVLLSFRLNDMAVIPSGTSYLGNGESGGGESGGGEAVWWDKVPSKFAGWGETEFRNAGFRAVPGCVVRHSAHVAAGAVLMPSFVNLGAYVDSGTMVDTWATVGSCAQIGKNVHLSGGAGIGGVRAALAWRGRGAVEEERRGDRRNKITHEEGGEATGAFAVQFSGSSKLVGRRVVPSQGAAASPLPPGAPSPRAAPPSCSASLAPRAL